MILKNLAAFSINEVPVMSGLVSPDPILLYCRDRGCIEFSHANLIALVCLSRALACFRTDHTKALSKHHSVFDQAKSLKGDLYFYVLDKILLCSL